jgi:hypothetical protein
MKDVKETNAQERLTSPNFPRREFAPSPSSAAHPQGRTKILRWLKEGRLQGDYAVLCSLSPYDDTFDLTLVPKGASLVVPSSYPAPTGGFGKKLDQATVNQIIIADPAVSGGNFDLLLAQ